MEMRPLGTTGVDVSLICLGTMTWGGQNTEAEGHAQMDMAVDRGVNFFDTAEMYAVPPTAETYGKTEEIVGTWFASRKARDRIVLATKIVGPARSPGGFSWVRGGTTRLVREHIVQAVDASLKRLQTDYIDLYQLHWPNRSVNMFGQLGWTPDPEEDFVAPLETLQALDEQVKAGKIRHIGLSNDTPWGVMRFLFEAEKHGLPRVQSVQNPYSLLNRSYEVGLAEISWREKVGLLAYAPFAAGTLSGKYLDGKMPAGSRRAHDGRGSRYERPNADAAVKAYLTLAKDHGLTPEQLALAFVNRQPFLTSSIVGATSTDQLSRALASVEVTLSDDVLQAIEDLHDRYTIPCP